MPGTFPVSRPVVFPLFGITPEGKCACGIDGCARVGKHPAVNWGDLQLGDEVPRPAPGAGAGLKTGAAPRGSDVFVVDLDSDDALEAWDLLGGSDETLVISTPRGWHLYFEHPGFHVKTSAGELGKGIDVRGDGGFVVAPGSPHRSGKKYEAITECALAPAPEWLLAWLKKQKAPSAAQHYPGDVSGDELAYRRTIYADYLKTEAPARGPALRGQGDQTLFTVVQRGAYDYQLPVDDVLELVREHYDPRCSPMWGTELEERVHHKAHDAKTTSTRPRMPPIPSDLASPSTNVNQDSTAVQPDNPKKPESTEDSRIANIEEIEASLKITWGHWDEPPPPAVYLIDPIVPEATIGVIVAKGSSLKTWLVLSMLSSVARGHLWLERFATTQSQALLIDFESGRDIIQERVHYLRFTDTPGLGIASFPHGRIDDQVFWSKLAMIVKARGVRLIAIDSFAAGATGVDENDPRSALPLTHATTFVEATRCAVLFIHHAKKGEGGDERDLVRGSGAIYGAADWVYTMIPQDEDRTKMLVRCIKAFRKKPDDFRVSLTIDGLVLDLAPAKGEATSSEIQQAISAALAHGPLATKKQVDRAIGKKNGIASAELDAMILRREVVQMPGIGYVLDCPAARRERVQQACQVPGLSTVERLANAAHVDVEEIHELLKAGVLFRSGTGFVFS